MGRGRPEIVSDERLLIELLIYPDRGVFTSELADQLNVSNQTIRDRMRDLKDQGYVEISELDAGNLYRLNADGMAYVRKLLRDQF